MKKNIFCIAFIFLYLSLSAQAQCRVIAPDAKEWAEKNQEKLAKMTRTEWLALEAGYRNSGFVWMALSPKQRHDFYRLKIEQVRDSFEWNKEEKEHLDKLYQYFIAHPDLYCEEWNEKNGAEAAEFTNKWATDAMEKLEWTPKLIQGMFMEHEDLLDKEGNVRATSTIEFKQLEHANMKICRSDFTSFEKKFSQSLSSDKDAIRLIGFRTTPIDESEKQNFIKLANEHREELEKQNTVFSSDFSFFRQYFPLHTAIVEYNEKNYYADENGVVVIPNMTDISQVKVVGRKRSETVHGTGSNIIKEDRILLKDEFSQAVRNGAKMAYSIEGNTVVFDFHALAGAGL